MQILSKMEIGNNFYDIIKGNENYIYFLNGIKGKGNNFKKIRGDLKMINEQQKNKEIEKLNEELNKIENENIDLKDNINLLREMREKEIENIENNYKNWINTNIDLIFSNERKGIAILREIEKLKNEEI
jgi:hypothetical protein